MRDINPQRLRYFYEVTVSGSIRGAAEKLNTAPSVITRQVRLLEEELGVRLFERSVSGTVPTEAANEVLKYWRACRIQQEDLEQTLNEMHELSRGHVRIASGTGFVVSLMNDIMVPFSVDYPNIQFTIETLGVAEIIESVATGIAQIGIAFNPPNSPRVETIAEIDMPLRLVVGPRHPLAHRKDPITLAEAFAHPLVMMGAPFGIRKVLDLITYIERIQVIAALTTNNLHVAVDYVKRTGAGAFMSGAHVTEDVENGKLFVLNVPHPLLEKGPAKMFVRPGHTLPRAAQEVIDWIMERSQIFRPYP